MVLGVCRSSKAQGARFSQLFCDYFHKFFICCQEKTEIVRVHSTLCSLLYALCLLVAPSTWSFGPRCSAEKPGPVEPALVGTPLLDSKRPLEILRRVDSFDPCIACAVHVIAPKENCTYTVRTG
jgi:hypothetical protein